MRFAQVAAGKILLHHVLVKSRHHNHDKDTTKELLEEVLPGYPVIEYENPAVFAALNSPDNTAEIQVQFLNREINDENQRGNQAESLQGICPYNGFYSAFMSVYPYQCHRTDGNRPKRNMHLLKYISMENQTDQVELCSRSQHTR